MKNINNSKLRIIPLGGLEQIGMNITAFEYRRQYCCGGLRSVLPGGRYAGDRSCDTGYHISEKQCR